MPQVSVILPTYNRRNRLRKALSSVAAQRGISFEILVVDDGSTDGTREMIASDFPDTRYFYQENRGPAAARNAGIREARAEWLAFLDSDDEWLPSKLRAQLDFAAEHPEVLIHQTEEIWIRGGRRVNPMKKHAKPSGRIFRQCLPLCVISPSAVIIHRRVFEACGVFDESFPACEDYDLWLRVAARFEVGLLERPYVVKHGGHPDQRSREFPAMDRFRIRALAKILASGGLSEEDARAARRMLERKARIYARGAVKRGKDAEAAEALALLR